MFDPDAPCIFASYSPIMSPCSRAPQAARPSWCSANAAAAMFHPASRSSRSSPSRSSVRFAANCAGTSRLRYTSDAPTNSWFTSIGPEAGDVRP